MNFGYKKSINRLVSHVFVLFYVGNCREGHFSVEGRCVSCFCAGIAKNCKGTGRYRNRITLRFTDEEDFKGTETTNIYETDRELAELSCCPIKYL